jgi:4-hydroxybenzoate polyprenyltransferase
MHPITLRRNQEGKIKPRVPFVKSQLILFQSRKKFAFLYCLATTSGLLCLPGVWEAAFSGSYLLAIALTTLPLPLASLLVTAGTYILNDLIDMDLDRANGKNRPLPSNRISKKQALAFVTISFTIAIALATITLSIVSLVIVTLMIAIGVAYSSPRTALMKRFVIKTISIAVFYMLCASLGMFSFYNIELAIERPALVASILLTLALMVFISSTLNDMGDIKGDKAAGRRTIPIVLGKNNTLKLAMILAASVLSITWIFYGASIAQGYTASLLSAVMTTIVTSIVMMTLFRMQNGSQDVEFMRKQHGKLFPMQMALHPSIICGVMMI